MIPPDGSSVSDVMPLRRRFLPAIAAAALPLIAWAGGCPQNLRGHATDWAIAVCYGEVQTDDPGHPEVSNCLGRLVAKDRIGASNENSCWLKRKYRAAWCRQLVHSAVEKSLGACMRSSRMPPQVENPPQ